MSETLHFKYKSPEDITLLLLNILYEKRKFEDLQDKLTYNVWRERFQQNDAKKIILRLMTNIYPDGCLLGELELNVLLDASIAFLKVDTVAQDILTSVKRQMHKSYVYSKYNNVVKPCTFGDHTSTVLKICEEFFGGEVNEFSADAIKKFVNENFELQGSQLSLYCIGNDIVRFYGKSY